MKVFQLKSDSKKDKSGTFTLSKEIPHNVVIQFHEIIYNLPIVIDFDWPSWT